MDNRPQAFSPTWKPALIPDPKGYYAVLDIQPNASPALIRAAYRVRAMELHPDRNDSLSSTPDFQRLQQAFDVLSDPARKAEYDAWAARAVLAASRGHASPARAPPTRAAVRTKSARFAMPAGLAALAIVVAVIWYDSTTDDADATRLRPPKPVSRQVAQPDPLRLLANTLPLPSSGILQLNLPAEAFASPDRLPRLKLVAPRDASFLVKLSRWDDNAEAMSVFVKAGDTTEVLVPTGRYRIRLASGVTWYGETLRFGPTTQYSQVETMSEFQPQGDRMLRHELLLDRFAGVDAASTHIPASSF